HSRGGAHAAQEQQDHDSRQHQSNQAFMNQVLNSHLHEYRLVENYFGHQLLGNVGEIGQNLLYPVDHGNGVGVAALLEDRQIHGRLAVNAHNVGLNFVGIFGLAHIRHHHRPVVAHALERQVVQILSIGHLSVGVEVVV